MAVSKKSIFFAKLQSFKNIVEKAPNKEKQDLIGTNLAEEFNKLILEIGSEYKEIKDSLPAKITSVGPFSDMQKADVNYMDFEIFTETVLSLLNLVNN